VVPAGFAGTVVFTFVPAGLLVGVLIGALALVGSIVVRRVRL
jgi:hypothetical protein